ncbi:MAG: TrmH family RNA methyltransferase [Limnothrix sp. CACIAM 69d]|nr:MAG: TrmH family RNA methyltransferase [Limnothrix sp. CACIAM 69d]
MPAAAIDLDRLTPTDRQALIDHLCTFVTPDRWGRIQSVIAQRTRQITVVLEDLYQPHNASAVLRSCDGFGIQDVHVIETRNQFAPNRGVSIGADRWLTLRHYREAAPTPGPSNTARCLQDLKAKGYTLVATTPHERSTTIQAVPIDRPLAILFGTELTGLTPEALELADHYAVIPMFGFSESFNISVSVALCLYDLTTRLRADRPDWALDAAAQARLQLDWLVKSLKAGDQLVMQFGRDRGWI